MLALLPAAAALPLCWRASRAWPAAAHLRSAVASARLLRFSAPVPAPPQSRPLWSVRERACHGGVRRTFSALGAAGACAAALVACRVV
jgi:hypothetical protein